LRFGKDSEFGKGRAYRGVEDAEPDFVGHDRLAAHQRHWTEAGWLCYSPRMNAIQKIKAAAAKLNPDEQVEFFRWWVESDTFKQRHLAALQREIVAGIEDFDRGRYQTYNDANVMQLAEEVNRSGRERLTKTRKTPKP
jgi:hypothetical protein